MAYGLYSTRLLVVTAAATWTKYRVPVGKRAVIRSVLFSSDLVTVRRFQMAIGSTLIYTVDVPVAQASASLETRTVVYGGEDLQGWVAINGCTLTISGYLFNDDGSLSADPLPSDVGYPPDPWPGAPAATWT